MVMVMVMAMIGDEKERERQTERKGERREKGRWRRVLCLYKEKIVLKKIANSSKKKCITGDRKSVV